MEEESLFKELIMISRSKLFKVFMRDGGSGIRGKYMEGLLNRTDLYMKDSSRTTCLMVEGK
jgi:hypothetical protein